MVGGNFASYGRMKEAWRLFSSTTYNVTSCTLPYMIFLKYRSFDVHIDTTTTREQDFVLGRRYAIILPK
jgi:hypothetical protein